MLVWALQSQDWLWRGHPSLSLDPPSLHSSELMCLCSESTTLLPPKGAHWLGFLLAIPCPVPGQPNKEWEPGAAPHVSCSSPGRHYGVQASAGISGDRWTVGIPCGPQKWLCHHAGVMGAMRQEHVVGHPVLWVQVPCQGKGDAVWGWLCATIRQHWCPSQEVLAVGFELTVCQRGRGTAQLGLMGGPWQGVTIRDAPGPCEEPCQARGCPSPSSCLRPVPGGCQDAAKGGTVPTPRSSCGRVSPLQEEPRSAGRQR